MRVILKLLTLIAVLAGSNVEGALVPSSSGRKPAQASTNGAPSTTNSNDYYNPQYLIVRGEGAANSHDNEEFNEAANILLQRHYDTAQAMASQTPEEIETSAEICGTTMRRPGFSIYDYTIVALMLTISLGIGVFYGFCQKSGSSSNEFLLGSGMSLFPVTLSLTTSFITAIELLGNPAEMYFQGAQFILILIPMIFVVPVAIKVFYPIYFKMELTSCYEYLGIRFDKEIRIFGALLYVIQMCFYTAVAVLAPAIALTKATGLNTILAVILIYVVCVFYSSQGGMKAVVVADTFQAVVLLIALFVVIILGCFYTGSPQEILRVAAERGRLELTNIDFDPRTRHTVWSIIIGGFFYWTSLFCTNQASVQKCMSLKSMSLAKVALGYAIVGLIAFFILNFYVGLMVFKHYADCDPFTSGYITARDQLLPFYIINTYEHVMAVPGIFVAGIFAASLGTVAAALNSLSAVTCEDLLVNGINMKISPEKGALYAKWMSLGFGIFSFCLVFIVQRLGGVLQATLTLNGLVGGVTLGLFVLGIAFKEANTKGAFYGGIAALLLVIFIGGVAQVANTDPLPLDLSNRNCNCTTNESFELLEIYERPQEGFTSWHIFHLSYMWYSMLGCLLTILLGWTVSIVFNFIEKRRIERLSMSTNINRTIESEKRTISVSTISIPDLTKSSSVHQLTSS